MGKPFNSWVFPLVPPRQKEDNASKKCFNYLHNY